MDRRDKQFRESTDWWKQPNILNDTWYLFNAIVRILGASDIVNFFLARSYELHLMMKKKVEVSEFKAKPGLGTIKYRKKIH
jgi:hypothetical protein